MQVATLANGDLIVAGSDDGSLPIWRQSSSQPDLLLVHSDGKEAGVLYMCVTYLHSTSNVDDTLVQAIAVGTRFSKRYIHIDAQFRQTPTREKT